MRRLLLLRHAKSSWSQPGASDHERPLNRRGQEAAPRIGAYLARHTLIPESVLCSTARRARETWELVAAEAPALPPASFTERIYDATPRVLLDVFRHAEPDAKSLLVVGHNPGLQEVATQLIASGDLEDRERLREKQNCVPTTRAHARCRCRRPGRARRSRRRRHRSRCRSRC
jgi:phosphohistidine phosphatase